MKKTCETCVNTGMINQKTGIYICPDCSTGFSNWNGLSTPEVKEEDYKPFFEQFRECDKNGKYDNGLCIEQNVTCYSATCPYKRISIQSTKAKTALYSDKWLHSILDEHSKEEIALLYQQTGLKKVEYFNKLSEVKKIIQGKIEIKKEELTKWQKQAEDEGSELGNSIVCDVIEVEIKVLSELLKELS